MWSWWWRWVWVFNLLLVPETIFCLSFTNSQIVNSWRLDKFFLSTIHHHHHREFLCQLESPSFHRPLLSFSLEVHLHPKDCQQFSYIKRKFHSEVLSKWMSLHCQRIKKELSTSLPPRPDLSLHKKCHRNKSGYNWTCTRWTTLSSSAPEMLINCHRIKRRKVINYLLHFILENVGQ